MNKVKLFMLVTAIAGMLTGCCGEDCNSKLYKTSATIYLVNETSGVVKSSRTFHYEIQPGQTLVHKESYTVESTKKPTTETYIPFAATTSFDALFFYDKFKCETGLLNTKNYENRKEVSPLVFEVTFKFTEERKRKAINCNKVVKDSENPFNQ